MTASILDALGGELEGHLRHWRELYLEGAASNRRWLSAERASEVEALDQALADQYVESTRPFLHHLYMDNSYRSADELEEIAQKLSPGGGQYTSGLFVQILLANGTFADPLLLAATVWWNWPGGRVGFQFLPDPAVSDLDEYEDQAFELARTFKDGTGGDPLRILTGQDRAFFASLPSHFTVYRGCSGIEPEIAGTGLCWTTSRSVAECFATRWSDDEKNPVVVTARVRKSEVLAARAGEFEIVVKPRRFRQIKCRPPKGRPSMEWTPPSAPAPRPVASASPLETEA